jgi:small GTP-binding protein
MVKNPFKRDSKNISLTTDNEIHYNISHGVKLVGTLSGHTDLIIGVVWMRKAALIATSSLDGSIKIWDWHQSHALQNLKENSGVYNIVLNSNETQLLSGSRDQTIKLWDIRNESLITTLPKGHNGSIMSVVFTSDDSEVIACSADSGISVWNLKSGKKIKDLSGHSGQVNSILLLEGKQQLLSASVDNTIKCWDIRNNKELFTLNGHTKPVTHILPIPNEEDIIISISHDRTIRLWDIYNRKLIKTLEGHTEGITGMSFSSDGKYLATKQADTDLEVYLWECKTWSCLGSIVKGRKTVGGLGGICFHPTEHNILAVAGGKGNELCIWELDYDVIRANAPKRKSVFYTTAKIALVGDSGVGKTTLGYRIAEKKFQETKSTHGQQFWVVNELGTTRADGTECEAVLWDFAGQQDYRLTHALFLDDVDLALVLFDASNQEEPLKGVEYWLKQLSQRERESKKILVAARIDRGRPAITQAELETFCDQHDVGGLVYTSAQENTGIGELVEHIKSSIDWEAMTTTVTTQTFKRIKEYVLALKADAARKRLLVGWDELRARLEEHYADDEEWTFTDAEMQTAVKHLTTHGYVTILRGRAGDETVLLAPDVLINLAASLVMEARGNPRGLGALEEEKALRGEYKLPELKNLGDDEAHVLLDAAVALFIEKNLCLRDTEGAQNLLIFPSLINQKRPLVENFEQVEGTSFTVSGPVEHVYPMMVVRLGYTNLFKRNNQWQNQAQYETGNGGLCGFRQIAEREGEIELVLYYEKSLPGHTRDMFEGMFKMFLNQRDLNITEYRPVICPSCSQQQERATIMRRTKEGRDFVICENCGTRISLREVTEGAPITPAEKRVLVREDIHSRLRNAYETNLTYVKGLRRDAAETVSCFVSYSWDDDKHKRWVYQLATDLRNAGLDVVFDRWELIPGANPARFMERIAESNFITVVGTPGYSDRYKNRLDAGTGVAAEMDLINDRMIGTEAQKSSVMPILRSGDKTASFPPFLRPRLYSDFKDDNFYFVGLFDLVLALYSIPFDAPSVFDLRQQMDDLARQVNVR